MVGFLGYAAALDAAVVAFVAHACQLAWHKNPFLSPKIKF